MASSEGMSFFSFLMMWHSFWRRVKVSLNTSLQNGFRNLLSECWERTSLKIDKNLCRYVIIRRCPTWYSRKQIEKHIHIWFDSINRQHSGEATKSSSVNGGALGEVFRCADLWYHGMTVFGLVRSWKASLIWAWMGRWDFPLQPLRSCWSALFRCPSVQFMNTLIHYDSFALNIGHESWCLLF